MVFRACVGKVRHGISGKPPEEDSRYYGEGTLLAKLGALYY
jgi:hypothetical protein